MSQKLNQIIHQSLATINDVILGKEPQVKLALASIFARGHILLEDLPGMGKTTLAQTLARVLGLEYKRIQFTSDLLPADVIGAPVFEPDKGQFRFHRGPVFTQVVLADELNRATPKSQSALLEAMEERQISIDGTSYPLPEPFFVIATQNPLSQAGTFSLPESQLDRFLVRFSLGYPDPAYELQLLKGNSRDRLQAVKQVLNTETLTHIQSLVPKVTATDTLLDYLQRLVARTREDESCELGLSPRGAIALLRASQAWALVNGRTHVLPEDVQAVFVPVAAHRIVGRTEKQNEVLARHLLEQVEVLSKE
ncbi:AAA family ATPase [Gynuella sp.]|uniref:AAA family ATPase n=1 Tax=Gynuella sp. TaxID=2969146 RepID=UPI003D0D4E2F